MAGMTDSPLVFKRGKITEDPDYPRNTSYTLGKFIGSIRTCRPGGDYLEMESYAHKDKFINIVHRMNSEGETFTEESVDSKPLVGELPIKMIRGLLEQ